MGSNIHKINTTTHDIFFVLALSRFSGLAFLIMRRHVFRLFVSSSAWPIPFKSF